MTRTSPAATILESRGIAKPRGKYVVAELVIPGKLCSRYLKTTPEKIAELNVKKNLIGSVLAGSTRSANAHFANMLLAVYLATGQDAANIVEGSQGFVHAEPRTGSGDVPSPKPAAGRRRSQLRPRHPQAQEAVRGGRG